MKSKLLLILVFAAGMLSHRIAGAQQAWQFTLQEANDYAMKNSYVVKNSGLDVNKARKKVWETIATGLPQISGSMNYTNFLNLPVSLIPGEFFGGEPGTYMPVKFGQDYNSDFGFTLNQLIFDGSYIVGVGSAKIYLQMAEQTKEKSEIEIRNAVSQAYYLTLVAEENLKVMKENLESSQKLYADTKAMYENGLVEEQDVDQMKLLVQSAENEVLKSEREIKISKIVLKYAMGINVDQEITLTDKLNQFVDPLIATGKQPNGFDYTKHIDYRMLDTQRLLTKKAWDLEKAAFLPTLKGFYSWSKTAYGNNANLFASSVPWFKSSMWGLTLSVPVFGAGQKIARYRQAQFEYEKIQNDQMQMSETLQKDYLTSVADLENALAQFDNTNENKQLAKKILDKTKIKYNNGISSSIELTQTESQYVQAQGTWVSSVMQLLTAKLNYDKAIGKL